MQERKENAIFLTRWEMALVLGSSLVALETGTRYLVVVDVTDSVDATSLVVLTGVVALVAPASLVAGTICAGHALRAAGEIGVTEVAWQTLAGSGVPPPQALSICSAGVGITGRGGLVNNWGEGRAAHEGVSGVAGSADADGVVSEDVAVRVGAALALARVSALVLDALLRVAAVAVLDALRPTVGRGADVVLLAGADGVAIDVLAVGVRAAGVGVARIDWLRGLHRLGRASDEGVTDEALRALADGIVVDHAAPGVGTAGADAGVNALEVVTGLILWAVGVDYTLWLAVWWLALITWLARAGAPAVAEDLLPTEGPTGVVGTRVDLDRVERRRGFLVTG